jgi:hypothetical protein
MTIATQSRKSIFGLNAGGWKTTLTLCVFSAVAAIASPAQTFNSLFSFEGTNGTQPTAVLVQGTDGNFYGTTAYGGSGGQINCPGGYPGGGTAFKVSAAWRPNHPLPTVEPTLDF